MLGRRDLLPRDQVTAQQISAAERFASLDGPHPPLNALQALIATPPPEQNTLVLAVRNQVSQSDCRKVHKHVRCKQTRTMQVMVVLTHLQTR